MTDETEGQEPEVESAEPISFSREDMSRVRNEAKNYRLKLRESERMVEDLTAENKGFKEDGKSELEKLASKVAEYETKLAEKDRELSETAKRSAIMVEVSKLPVVDPDAVYRLLDTSTIENPADIKKAIGALLKEKPYLVKESGPPTPGAGGAPLKSKKSADEQFAAMLRQAVRK